MEHNMAQGNRVNFWDNLKYFLILFVIIHHATIPYVVIKDQHWTEVVYMIIMPYTMATFTMISGYWFKPRPLNILARRFLLPCLLITFIFNSLQTYSPIEFMNRYSPWGLGIMWYLWVLFFYCWFTPWLMKLGLNRLIVLAVVISLVAGFFPVIGGRLSLSRMIGFYPFFLLGIKLRQTGWVEARRSEKRSVMLARIVFLVLLALYFVAFLYYRPLHLYISFNHSYEALGVRVLGCVLRAFTYLICGLLSVTLIVAVPDKRYWFTKYGARSLTPYILHPIVLILVCWNWAVPVMTTWYGYVIYLLLVPLFCMMLANKHIDGFVKKLTS